MNGIIGIDEVGRGSWAGPLLVVAARQRQPLPDGLTDSKALTPKQRQSYVSAISACCDIGEGWVEPQEIDLLGLTAAMRLGVKRALIALHAKAEEPIIMDGHINYCSPSFKNVRCVIKADALYPAVSAASVFAKTKRDQHMKDISLEFPGYDFENNVGYGTSAHLAALKKIGASVLHRRSYKPVQTFL